MPHKEQTLPRAITRLIGREEEVAHLEHVLSYTRLLTLVGPGGTGKTRLALEVADHVADRYSDGVYFCELESVRDGNQVARAVADTLGVKEESGESLTSTLTDALRDQNILLVLDNCEHLIAACAALCASLLRYATAVVIMTTSRELLSVSGETVWTVPPLRIPDEADTVDLSNWMQYEGIQLFVDRAVAVRHDFVVTGQNVSHIARICRQLDGIALAIILAATRVQTLQPQEIADRLEDRFRLLTGRNRNVLPRQQTLRALIDWSHDLLQDDERIAWRRLSVCRGGFTLDAAEAIVSGRDIVREDVFDIVTRLVEKSILSIEGKRFAEDAQETAITRYRMLETLSQYGREHLLEAGEVAICRERHRMYYATWCANWTQQSVDAVWPDEQLAAQSAQAETGNLMAAIDDAVEAEAWEDLMVILVFTQDHVVLPLAQRTAWKNLVSVQEATLPTSIHKVLFVLNFADSIADRERAVRLADELGHPFMCGITRVGLAETYINVNRLDDAERVLREADSMNLQGHIWCTNRLVMGKLLIYQHHPEAAKKLIEETLASMRGREQTAAYALQLLFATWAANELNDTEDQVRYALAYVDVYRTLGLPPQDDHLCTIAGLLCEKGQQEIGVNLLLDVLSRMVKESAYEDPTYGLTADELGQRDALIPVLALAVIADVLLAQADHRAVATVDGLLGKYVSLHMSIGRKRSRDKRLEELQTALGKDVLDKELSRGTVMTLREGLQFAFERLQALGVSGRDESDHRVHGNLGTAVVTHPSPSQPVVVKEVGSSSDLVMVQGLRRLSLAECTVVGDYRRFDEQTRHGLRDWQLRIASPLRKKHRTHENFLIWAAPGSGKSFLIQEIARSLGESVQYFELNLARLGQAEWVEALRTVRDCQAPVLCMLDEIDARADERWPYEEAFALLDANLDPKRQAVFVLVGSSGGGLEGMVANMLVRSKATDMLDRVPVDRRFRIPAPVSGDKAVILISQVLDAAARRGLLIEEVEQLAVYYALVDEGMQTPRQLRDLAVAAVERLPAEERRLRYDDLFYRGDRRSKDFWTAHAVAAEALSGHFVRVDTAH